MKNEFESAWDYSYYGNCSESNIICFWSIKPILVLDYSNLNSVCSL